MADDLVIARTETAIREAQRLRAEARGSMKRAEVVLRMVSLSTGTDCRALGRLRPETTVP